MELPGFTAKESLYIRDPIYISNMGSNIIANRILIVPQARIGTWRSGWPLYALTPL